mgnify:CR=1 FL=1
MKIAFITLGCKLNYAETSTYERRLLKEGFEAVPWSKGADVFLVNTCTVTEHSDKKSRNIIRKLHRQNPEAFIFVTGCYAQLKKAEIEAIEGVTEVFGANEKSRIVPSILEKVKGVEISDKGLGNFFPAYSSGERTRSFLKVQDGCDYKCHYCTVPYARGESRNIPIAEIIPQAELYSRTGIQKQSFNTIYQLYADKLSGKLDRARHLLMMPEYLSFKLTGEMRNEYTEATTSNLVNAKSRQWDKYILGRLGLPEDIFLELSVPGTAVGRFTETVKNEVGFDSTVILCPSHDTASAVVATPSLSDDFVYISCGTWSLFGIENETPILTEAAAAANFANEGGFMKTTRFLKNIIGLWLIQESRRQWRREGVEVGFDTLEKEALEAEPFRCFIDVDNQSFAPAGNLPKRVKEFCERTGQYVPQTRGEIMRCIYQSLAMKYKYTFNGLHSLTGKDYNRINMLGGGIKDKLLCQLTADACGCEVLAGPTEATVMGNIAVVYYALGEIEDFAAIRQTVINSTDLKQYLPTNSEAWDKAYEDYKKIIGK